ncbi:hypothetical protein UFOVP5_26 [uncultured Caudovirales phage]|uniref:Uncharacterized protein n=1 Tax=uncultured Caudovirales phage TaxID=2100421 RepID=A0A6J5KKR0_9CAUD|nr:hypothetical protein UFOVP5_26 [uncultured Caudovirales phage]
MTEITQADRDAAASGYYAWIGNNRVIPQRMRDGEADDHSMVQAFARHREQAVAHPATPEPAGELVEALEALLAEARERGGGVSNGERLGCTALSRYAKGGA